MVAKLCSRSQGQPRSGSRRRAMIASSRGRSGASGALVLLMRCRVLVSCVPGAGDGGAHQVLGLRGIDPAHHLDPFAALEILVVAEEMGDLLAQQRRQVAIIPDILVEGMER